VRADATLAEQVIGNVIANAVAHTSPDTHVVVDADVAADAIALRVTDDGPGIAGDLLPQIFGKFVKGEEYTKIRADDRPGTGVSNVPRRRKPGYRPRTCYCQGHYGGSWRCNKSRESSQQRTGRALHHDVPV